METKFKVVMKKNEEILKDFISFRYRAQGKESRTKARIFMAALIVIGILAIRDGNVKSGTIMCIVGAVMILGTFLMSPIAVSKIKKADIGYKNGTEYEYRFASGSMYVYENGELAQNVGSYRQVSCFYGDEKNFYVGVNNDDLYLLPIKNFVEGNPDEFIDFIQNVSDEKYEFLPLTLKNKWLKYKTNQKLKDMEYDARAAAKRAEAKEKKNKKK